MEQLQQIMYAAGVSTYRELCQQAGVSEKQLRKLRRGEIQQLRLITLEKISQALKITIAELLELFSSPNSGGNSDRQTLEREYARLQEQLKGQKELLLAEFQKSSLQTLESWLLQWATVCYAIEQNPQIPAARLLKLVQPVEELIKSWGIEEIAQVGSEIPYDPQQHQLMEGTAQPGDLVKVRYAGYQQHDKLLYRAKVSPVAGSK